MARRVDIAQQLRDDIVGGCFGASSRVTIDELAARYGSSHMPIREALHELVEVYQSRATPTLVIGDEVIVGFDRERIERLLELS